MFINVILPLALPQNYTYSVPSGLEDAVEAGMRVIVPLGAKKIYTALVWEVNVAAPEMVEPKEMIMLLDSEPIVTAPQMKLWQWIASYYECTLGEVMKAALPSGLKLESETEVTLVADFEAEKALKPKEQELLDFLGGRKKPARIDEINKAIDVKNALPIVNRLLDMGAVAVDETVRQKERPKEEICLALAPQLCDEDNLRVAYDSLKKAPQQQRALAFYIARSHVFSATQVEEVTRKEMVEKFGQSVIKNLIDKQILTIYGRPAGRNKLKEGMHSEAVHALTPVQSTAMEEIKRQMEQKQVVLLHGVTSSGKTEIYIHLMEETIKKGKQVLFLLPEIALTTQITNRLRRVFGGEMSVYHSKFSDADRVEVWRNMLRGKHCKVILGVRSSVLLPFNNLGLVVVDEEHETSYKQFDPAPRYNARDAAVVLAMQMGGHALLGSATPAVESYFNARTGKYGLVTLSTRYEGIELPQVVVADIKEAIRTKQMKKHFTPQLLSEMKKAFERKEQVILFQNRRGFSPYVQCTACGYVAKCQNCDVSLTYHKFTNLLSCHYCGFTYPMPQLCPACGNPSIEHRGLGTEKIEEEVAELFPGVKVARLDLDVASTRRKFESIIKDFEEGKTDVLVGTQMVSKGLDFERVHVVGILNADSMLSIPDFRANERAYQLMAQVSGRAGRKGRRGVVVIQTSQPQHQIVELVRENDYVGMYAKEMEERQVFRYPPYFRLSNIYVRGKNEELVAAAAFELASSLRRAFGERVYGPDSPVITRINTLHIRQIVLKIERGANLEQMKRLCQQIIFQTKAKEVYRNLIYHVDIDPA